MSLFRGEFSQARAGSKAPVGWRAASNAGFQSTSIRKIVATRNDFSKLTEGRFVIGFSPPQAQSRLQAGAPFWLRLCRACAVLQVINPVASACIPDCDFHVLRFADWKSAMQQISNLRYLKAPSL